VENLALWKRALAEFSAVFLLASIGLMTVATALTTGAYGLFELSIAFGFAITVMVVVSGAVSGAHFNPAITIMLASFRRFPWRDVPLYIAAQISGGVVGALVLYFFFSGPIRAFEAASKITRGQPNSSVSGMIFACYSPQSRHRRRQAMAVGHHQHPTAVLAEAFATLILAIVVFAAVDTRNSFAPNLPLFALWIGFIIAFIIMVEAPLTMACINPARDLGPRIAITMLGWGAAAFPGVGRPWWVWTVGPILGALAGGAAWTFIFGKFLTPRPVDLEAAGVQADRLETPTPGGDPHRHGNDEDEGR
jgi:glycerol uptake facilitator protein